MRNKVYVIGFDGATFDLMGPWIEAGLLPHLQAMMETGVSGGLESTVPPVTIPAWTSFATGHNPGRYGVYEFKAQDRQSYQYHVADARSRRGKAIWDFVGNAGGKVVILNFPNTYPPDKVNGVMISGFMTPSGRRDFVHPPELLEEIERQFGKYPLYYPAPHFILTGADADIDRFLQECNRILDYKFEVAQYLIEKVDPDFLGLHIYGGDQISHWLWHILDEEHPRYERRAYEKHGAKILNYYQRFDAAVGKLAEKADEETTVLVISDHGNGPIHKAIELNIWLLQEGYLALKETPTTKVRYHLWKMGLTPRALLERKWVRNGLGRLAKRLMENENDPRDTAGQFPRLTGLRLSYQDVDWSRTRAFCSAGPFGQIKINLKGEWSQGCVSAGVEYETLRNEIVQKLKELRDPETGERIEGQIFIKDDIYSGPYLDDAPDITFLAVDRKYLTGGYDFISNKVFFELRDLMTGCHRMNGILVGRGRDFQPRRYITGARIIDLCPMILYLMGLKIPEDIDGKVLSEMFTETFLRENPIEVDDEAGREVAVTVAANMTAEEEADVLARLRGLGYLE